MSIQKTRSAKIEGVFVGDGEYPLCLKIGQLIELQEKLGVGPNMAAQRLFSGQWMIEDVTQTIRLALIGGGMDPRRAFGLVERYVIEGHLLDYASAAGAVLFAALSGPEDEPIDSGEDDSGEALTPKD